MSLNCKLSKVLTTALGVAAVVVLSQGPAAAAPSQISTGGDGVGFDVGVESGHGQGPESPDAKPSGGPLIDTCGLTKLDDELSRIQYPDLWTGHEPGSGHLYRKLCNDGGLLNPVPVFLANEVAPPPDPAVIAQQAIDTIQFPIPQPQLGPEEQLAVNRWIYLTVDDPGVLTAEAAVPGLAVTASATLTSSTWAMGETWSAGSRATIAPLTCPGGGTAPSAAANLRASEPKEPGTCAYAYALRSLPERTGGAGTWPVTVTTTWSIVWTATDGATGTATRSQTSAPLATAVGQWESELVPG